MKVIKFIFVVFVLFATACTSPQTNTKQEKDVTTFLGIPVDGTKNKMIQKLESKGFTYDILSDILKGEFNGRDVEISVVTNKLATDKKVYRIMVRGANYTTNTKEIKIRYNNLYYQFKNNSKYRPLYGGEIKKDEDISYKMIEKEKVYESGFMQKNKKGLWDKCKTVWFRIEKQDSNYGIIICYENGYNKANGEDL